MKKIIIVLFAAILLSACGRADKNAQGPAAVQNGPGNLLANPGFEDGAAGWKWLEWSKAWAPFEISDKISHTGKKSAMIKFEVTPGSQVKKVHGVVQSLTPPTFPAKAGGWYKVENWNRGATKQYIQFVVIAWEPFPAGPEKTYPNFQLRYVLEGTSTPPLQIANAKYTIMTKDAEPKTGEWKYFELNIRDDYQKLWGKIPDKYERIDVFWEARFDEEPKENARIVEEVYFDDLFVGEENK